MTSLPRHRRQQPLDRRRDALDVAGVGAEQDALRQRIVLGLAEQIHRHPVGRRRAVGEDQDLARPGDHVDPDRAEDAPLGARDVGVARAGDLVHRRNRRRAVGERADRLRAADREQPVDARDRSRGEDQRVALAARHRRAHDDLADARDLGRHGVHQHARRIRREAAGDVDADALERRHLLAEQACRRRRDSSTSGRPRRAGARGSRARAPRRFRARAVASPAGRRARPAARPRRPRAPRPRRRRCRRSAACSRARRRRRGRGRRRGSPRRSPRSRRRPRPSRRAAPRARRRNSRRCVFRRRIATLIRPAPSPPRPGRRRWRGSARGRA